MSYKIAKLIWISSGFYIFFTDELLNPYKSQANPRHHAHMKTALFLALLLPPIAGLGADYSKLVKAALADPSHPHLQALRDVGPEAFRELERQLKPQLTQYLRARHAEPNQAPDPKLQRAADLLDAVAGQRDAYMARLFWFTDLAAAKSEAARTNRPILSLRMLGNLTDEYSCANSRLFRSVLYSDPAIAARLRDNMVLHWESVRPVPKITIDFGDGRLLHRTITGNSIHYILTSEGKIADALPGMYQPTAFLAELNESLEFLHLHENKPSESALLTRLALKRAALIEARNADFAAAGVWAPVTGPVAGFPEAREAFGAAFAKTAMERPLVTSIATTPRRKPSQDPAPWMTEDPEIWEKVAALHKAISVSPASLEYMKTKMPRAIAAAELAHSKMSMEFPMVRMMARLESSLAADTARNQYDFRPRILARLTSQKDQTLNKLNDWVYATLFLTPNEDKWLGLRSDQIFTALENDGIEISQ